MNDLGLRVGGLPVELAGRRPAPGETAILLVHGSGWNHHFFDPLRAALPELPILTPSLPGRLTSAGPPLQSLSKMSEWLVELCDRLELRRVILGGHSMGSAVVLETFLEHRASFAPALAGLVLLGAGRTLAVRADLLRSIRVAIKRGDIPEASWFAYHATTPRERIAELEAARVGIPTEAVLADWYASNGFDRRKRHDVLDLPTLIVAGRDDGLTPPSYALELAGIATHPELVVLEAAGHMFPLERVAEVAPRLAAFAARLG